MFFESAGGRARAADAFSKVNGGWSPDGLAFLARGDNLGRLDAEVYSDPGLLERATREGDRPTK